MSLPLKSQLDLYNLFISVLQDKAPTLTDTLDGSDIDALGGVFSVAGIELQRQTLLSFNKTFFDLANGPEITGGPDDLQTLAVDHFGNAFARPGAVAAIDVATFSRVNNSAGAVTIPAGTVIKTQTDANGNAQRYTTNSTVNLTATGAASDLTVTVGVTAVLAGAAGDATSGTINAIESTLTDPTIVVTNAGNATGEDAQDDATYRETIHNLIVALRAATKTAIESMALTVSGVVVATAIEIEKAVVYWNPATNAPLLPPVAGLYQYFQIPSVTLYVADATGSANSNLINAVSDAIDPVRAFGVFVNVKGVSPVSINWNLKLTLNPSGPNYSTFSSDTSKIINTMTNYIASLGTGVSFIRTAAEAAVLAVWGPAGTNDITAVATTLPTGDISITSTQNAIPGTIKTV